MSRDHQNDNTVWLCRVTKEKRKSWKPQKVRRRAHLNRRPSGAPKSAVNTAPATVKSQIFVRYLISYFRTFEKSAKFNWGEPQASPTVTCWLGFLLRYIYRPADRCLWSGVRRQGTTLRARSSRRNFVWFVWERSSVLVHVPSHLSSNPSLQTSDFRLQRHIFKQDCRKSKPILVGLRSCRWEVWDITSRKGREKKKKQ